MNIKRNIIFSLESRKKDGKLIIENVPIRMRVVYASKRIDFTTGYRIDAAKWETDRQRVKNGCTNKLKQSSADINSGLDKFSNDIQTLFKEYEIKGIVPTPKQLKDSFNKKQRKDIIDISPKNSLTSYFNEFIEEGTPNWAESTTKKFITTRNHLSKFDKDLTFDALTLDRLTDFVNHLLKVNLRNNSIHKQMTRVKTFLRWGIEKGHTENNAFESFKHKLKTTPKKVVFLSWDELKQLRGCKIPETKQYLERVRDVFLFLCYTGLRYSDVYNLKKSDVKGNQIEITTIKTTDNLIIELNNYSREILDKYKNIPFENNKVLPVISNQRMNEYLKELGELANLNEPVRETYYKRNRRIDDITPKHALLSTHAGRRTFICNSLAMGIPAQTVMKWTGHSDYHAMKPYIDIADRDREEAMQLWNKREDNETDKLLEQIKVLPKEKLISFIQQNAN